MTAQTTDDMFHQGCLWSVHAELLRPWLRAHPGIARRFQAAGPGSFNWRGYRASWTTTGDTIRLAAITSAAFKDAVELSLLAGWITGAVPLLNFQERAPFHSRDAPATPAAAELLVLHVEEGRILREERLPVGIVSTIGGRGISHDGPERQGIAGDDSYWGLPWAPRPWPGAAKPSSASHGALFDDGRDRWRLMAALGPFWRR